MVTFVGSSLVSLFHHLGRVSKYVLKNLTTFLASSKAGEKYECAESRFSFLILVAIFSNELCTCMLPKQILN